MKPPADSHGMLAAMHVTKRFCTLKAVLILLAAGWPISCSAPVERDPASRRIQRPSAPVPVKTRALLGCYYSTGWGDPSRAKTAGASWKDVARLPGPRPLLGYYDGALPEVHAWHLKWAVEHGVSFFAFDWYYNKGEGPFDRTLDEGFLRAASPGGLRFCLNWRNGSQMAGKERADPSAPSLVEMIGALCRGYFAQPEYLILDGRPVFFIEDTLALLDYNTRDELRGAFSAMRRAAEDAGFAGLYLIAVNPWDSADYVDLLQDLGYDAFTGRVVLHPLGREVSPDSQAAPYSDMAARYMKMHVYYHRMARPRPIRFLPSAAPGWNDAPLAGKSAHVITDASPALYESACWSALRYADEQLPIVMAGPWNAWEEGAWLEPDSREGFNNLEVLKKVFVAETSPAEAVVPDGETVQALSALTPSEWKRALGSTNTRQSLPSPAMLPPATAEARPGVVPDWDFAGMNTNALAGWIIDGARRSTITADGLTLDAGADARITTPVFASPVDNVRGIVIEMQARPAGGAPSNYSLGCIQWRTTKHARFSEYDSTHFAFSEQGGWQRIRILPGNLRSWDEALGHLIQLRIDFGSRSGRRIILRRLTVE